MHFKTKTIIQPNISDVNTLKTLTEALIKRLSDGTNIKLSLQANKRGSPSRGNEKSVKLMLSRNKNV